MQSQAPTRKVLFIGPVFPEPTSSAAGVRTVSLLEDFLSHGDRILFASASDQNSFAGALNARGVETVQIGPNDPEFDRIVREFAPDVVVFDRFMLEEQFGWRIAEVAPQALRILDTIDLHFLRRVRGDWLKAALPADAKSEGAAISDSELRRISRSLEGIETEDCLRELAAIYRSDLTLVLSRFEFRLLRDHFRIAEPALQFLGFSCPSPDTAAWPSFTGRKHFATIGNFRHLPNRDATFWLARVLWPKLREELASRGEREVELHVFGAYPPKEIMALDSPKTSFRVIGPVDDAVATLRGYRVCLAPIRFGAGIKGKIADAWSAGTPVVTTPLGAEGMETREGGVFAGRVTESEPEFVREAAALYGDADRSAEFRDLGHVAITHLYSAEENRRTLLARIDELLSSPECLAEHRRANLVGRILRNEAHGRTKYFSKWIEAKNRPKEESST
jgi:glycosyltransferase involved in cell wall biosynthesis